MIDSQRTHLIEVVDKIEKFTTLRTDTVPTLRMQSMSFVTLQVMSKFLGS